MSSAISCLPTDGRPPPSGGRTRRRPRTRCASSKPEYVDPCPAGLGDPRWTVAFLVLTLVIAVPAVPFAVLAGRDLDPGLAVTTPGPPGHCVEHSGGDTRCLGG